MELNLKSVTEITGKFPNMWCSPKHRTQTENLRETEKYSKGKYNL